MKSLWNDNNATQYQDALGLRVYSSRLLGQDPNLVLHGGGNTSVKITETNLVGDKEERLYVKGSGWDLATIEAAGFTPLRMAHLLKLAKLEHLSDPQMVNELKTQMTDASAPSPSVETILHATLPYKYVEHTHADAIVSITNTVEGEQRIRSIYGDRVVIIPYVMPGFDLARLCAQRFATEAHDDTLGMVLLNHGIFSFADSAKLSYERMIDLVALAEDYLASKNAWGVSLAAPRPSKAPIRGQMAALRRDISRVAGFPMIVAHQNNDKGLAFAQHPEVGTLSQQGPATPDHVIRTKYMPMLGRDADGFASHYKKYFDTHAPHAKQPKTMLDPTPRVVLDPELGLCTVGRSAKDADITADIYDHTIDVILRATALGGFKALPPEHLFDMEYWDLEQAKLNQSGALPVFAGEVALITGGASGIGKACVDAMLKRGAAVIALDINADIATLHQGKDYRGIQCDVSDGLQLNSALETGIAAFGGLDMLVLNAGVFPGGKRIASLEDDEWHQVFKVNLDANLALMRECHPLLKLAPRNGRVVIMGSKNVLAPGPGAAAYSASKSALVQLMRIAALEWAEDGIRINALHPDAVFDTAIWTGEVLAARAGHYGMNVDDYKRKNLLKTEICSQDVAELAAEMCGPLFAKTTAAQVPIDGGNERVI
ncbi:MAG TPA: bifunctional aldolase/short-chain dehydrogenase [Acidiferrobacteraceae bacterium]|nr:bifunctional aldolase/short-chain dehydrogenase [Acidiferrobacteraceae bacterium]